MIIETKSNVDGNEWNSLLEQDGKSVFKTFEWSKFTSDNPRYLVATENGKLIGVMHFREDKMLFRKVFISDSLPVAKDEKTKIEILRNFMKLRGMKIINTTYQDDKYSSLATKVGFKFTDKSTVIVDLKKFDSSLRSLDKKRRYDVNKAVKEGAEVVDSTKNMHDWEEFYNIYRRAGNKWGISILNKPQFMKFKEMSSHNLVKLFLVKINGKPVSGSIVLNSGNTAIFFINATDPGSNHGHTNSLLVWENLTYGKKNGFEYFDLFGYDLHARPNEKTYGINKFKLSFDGVVKRFYKFTDSNLFVIGRKLYNKIRILKNLYLIIQTKKKT